MSETEVNWSYLPHSPELFFGCDENATRRDLKRSYNRLLKKFKPEQYPEEFKKIRQAFEDLDAQISYGFNKTISSVPQSSQDDVDLAESEPQAESDPFANDPFELGFYEDSEKSPIEFQENISPFDDSRQQNYQKELSEFYERNSSTEELLEFIDKQDNQSSGVILLAAMIRETTGEQSSLLDIVLASYKKNPQDGHTKSFLFHLLRSRHQTGSLEERLETVARLVNGNDFYYFTEQLWFKLLEEKGPDKCCDKIAELEGLIGYIPPTALSVFYLRFCTRFIFELKEDFLREKVELIEEYSADFSWSEDNEAHFLDQLLDYRMSLNEQLLQCPVHQELQKIIHTWCQSDEATKSQNFINEIILFDTSHLLAKNDFNNDSLENCIDVFETICAEVKEDNYDDEEELYDDDEKNKKIRVFMLKIEDITDSSFFGSLTTFVFFGLFMIHLSIVLVPTIYSYNYVWGFLSESVQQSSWRYAICATIFASLGVPYFYFGFLPVHEKFEKVTNFFCQRLYKKIWRREVIQFFKQNPIEFNEFYMELIYMENTTGITNNAELSECLQRDHALRLFSSIHSLQI